LGLQFSLTCSKKAKTNRKAKNINADKTKTDVNWFLKAKTELKIVRAAVQIKRFVFAHNSI
jgi:hypothetical protein